MNLIVDEGNTNIKLGAFEKNRFLWVETFQDIQKVLARIELLKPDRILISTVKNIAAWEILKNNSHTIFFDSQTVLPIQINYNSRETLGTDRIAAASGASMLYPNSNCLFFDVGTCLTHGFIDKSGVFQGGSISPGLDMRLQALHHFTAKLPYIAVEQEELTGHSTKASITSGVINGMTFEISGFIEAYQNKYVDLIVLMTGGNALLFEKRLKQPIFVVAELNLIGLNRILNHNV
jgi:type III pantothenate kinase